MTSTKKGARFEELIKQIEEITLPNNFEITSRKCIYDEGIQLAEFDIDILGNINGVEFKWLIECRDRPSEGPAPTAWIEQLIGRKQLYRYSTVTAVSTTGFSQGAERVAKRGNIDLRRTFEVTFKEVCNWIHFSTITLVRPIGVLLESTIFFDHDNFETKKGITSSDTKSSIFKNIKTNEKANLGSLFDRALNSIFLRNPTLEYFQEENLPKKFRFTADCKNIWVLQSGRKNIPVRKILFRAETRSLEKSQIPISKVYNYSKNDSTELIAQSVCFSTEVNNEEIDINFHKPSGNKKAVYMAFKRNNIKKSKPT
jgi:hypothetical protein